MKNDDQAKLRHEYLVCQYLDGTLSETERRAFEDELRGDVELVALVEAYRSADRMVGEWGRADCEIDWSRFQTDVRRRREAVDSAARRTQWAFRLFTPLAAAASIAITFVLLNRPMEPRLVKRAVIQHRVVVSEVSVERPGKVGPSESVESFVSYARRSDEATATTESTVSGTVVALAAVGPNVNWPELESMRSSAQ